MKRIYLAGLLLAIMCSNFNLHASDESKIVDVARHFGPILPSWTEQDVIKFFGAKNVSRDSTGDEDSPSSTRVETDKYVIEIDWKHEFKQPSRIRLRQMAVENPGWVTKEGIQFGASLAEIEKINGRPFQYVFGEACCSPECPAISWQGGNLSSKLQLRFKPSAAPQKLKEEYSNPMFCKERSSSDSKIKQLNLIVQEILVNW